MSGWDVQPTLDWAIARAQVAGALITGSWRPKALIHRRQRLIYELRLCKLANLSWSAPKPAARDLAVTQHMSVFVNHLVQGPEVTGDSPSRHIPI